jgi:hypothetical protein
MEPSVEVRPASAPWQAAIRIGSRAGLVCLPAAPPVLALVEVARRRGTAQDAPPTLIVPRSWRPRRRWRWAET